MTASRPETPLMVGQGGHVDTELSSRIGGKTVYSLVAALLILHALMLTWTAYRDSPVLDEVAHLPAGISHLHFGRFDLFHVNPPLVRMVAAVPVVLAGPETDWDRYDARPGVRKEFFVGTDFINANGKRSFWYFTLARWACIPFSLLGGYICFRWARQLYGDLAGMVALSLWCFSPNIIAHGHLITPDLGATALGVTAAYVFWRWLKRPSWRTTFAAGVALGLAELAKTSWVVLIPLWPLLWLLWRCPQSRHLSRQAWFYEGRQLAVILLLGVYVINLGYGFEGSFQKLRDFKFFSKTLTVVADEDLIDGSRTNRFADTWLGAVSVPLPKKYVMGIDMIKKDFEDKKWSYLRGEWRFGGWWYYYLYALVIKVPLGIWILVLLALFVGMLRLGYASTWRDELILLAPIAVVLTLVSSQSGASHHLRYVLLIFPFAFIWTSKLARAIDFKHWKVVLLASAALLWSITSSVWIYPHSLSYFNELVGGPRGGHAHLDYSNIDWGQDYLYLKQWLDKHPEAFPLGLSCHVDAFIDPKVFGIEYTTPPIGPNYEADTPLEPDEMGPKPGWYAISVQRIRGRKRRYAYFLRFQPVAMAGYSIYIYHITLDGANRVRRDLGLPPLPETKPVE